MTNEQGGVKSVWRTLDEAFVRHATNKDAAALVSAFYAPDAQLLPPNAPLISGSEAIREFWQGLLDAGGADVTLDTTLVGMSGEMAYGIGQYSFTLPSASGERTHERGKYLVVYRRQAEGSWKVAADMFSSDQPAS
jgi:ketosteroid isomerase-like protein